MTEILPIKTRKCLFLGFLACFKAFILVSWSRFLHLGANFSSWSPNLLYSSQDTISLSQLNLLFDQTAVCDLYLISLKPWLSSKVLTKEMKLSQQETARRAKKSHPVRNDYLKNHCLLVHNLKLLDNMVSIWKHLIMSKKYFPYLNLCWSQTSVHSIDQFGRFEIFL